MTKKSKVISINSSKEKHTVHIDKDETVLIVDGEVIYLDEFIIAGKTTNNQIISSTFNCSLEESIFYKEVMSVTLKEELIRRLSEPE